MKKQVLAGVGSAVLLLSILKPIGAVQLELKPFVYTQDFEKADPFEFWTSNGGYAVNFKGLTEEKAFSGKKSFKLDVTFGEKGHYFYWSIPMKVPAEGKLKFSGYIFLGEKTTGSAGIGADIDLCVGSSGTTVSSGCGPFNRGKKGEWKLIEGDLAEFGKRIADSQIPRTIWAAKGENSGIYQTNIGLFLYGGKGKRVVVYVDDIRMEGEVPTEESYKEEMKRRWAPVKRKFDKKISYWVKVLEGSEGQLKALGRLSGEAKELKKEVEEQVQSLKRTVGSSRKKGYISGKEQRKVDEFLEQFKNIIFNIKAISKET